MEGVFHTGIGLAPHDTTQHSKQHTANTWHTTQRTTHSTQDHKYWTTQQRDVVPSALRLVFFVTCMRRAWQSSDVDRLT